jgi:ribosome recycling factor
MTDMKDLKNRMESTVEVVRKELSGLRTGRASASLLDPIQVEAYGSVMPITQVASVTAPEARMLVVQIWDQSMTQAVDKAIRQSDLGLNPVVDGQTLRVPLPDLTEDRRKDIAKIAGKYAEQGRVAIRNVRRDGMDTAKKAEKDGDISQDEQRGLNDGIQKLTDANIKALDELLASKEKEIMQI